MNVSSFHSLCSHSSCKCQSIQQSNSFEFIIPSFHNVSQLNLSKAFKMAVSMSITNNSKYQHISYTLKKLHWFHQTLSAHIKALTNRGECQLSGTIVFQGIPTERLNQGKAGHVHWRGRKGFSVSLVHDFNPLLIGRAVHLVFNINGIIWHIYLISMYRIFSQWPATDRSQQLWS